MTDHKLSEPGSVTRWITSLRNGDERAASLLWDRYFQQMVDLARKRYRSDYQTAYDAEDVALSAFKSAFIRVTRDNASIDLDRDGFWRFVANITLRKVCDAAAYHQRQKRNPLHDRAGIRIALEDQQVIDPRSESPDLAAATKDELANLLNLLPKPDLRQIALLKLEGYTNREIAGQLDRGLSTIERKLQTIRRIWRSDNA